MSDPRCIDCLFSCDGVAGLICRRYPPMEHLTWPVVRPKDWCGEYQPRN